jgi:glutathione S-transferase
MHNTEAGVSTDSKSSTKKPYAGKVRIVLEGKDTPFELIIEVPWDSAAVQPH